MSVTLGLIVQGVKKRLRDPEFDEDDIKEYVNECQDETLGESPYTFREKMDESIEVASGELSLPRDYQVTRRITAEKDHVGQTLKYMDPRAYIERLAENRSSISWHYTIFGGKVYYCLPKDTTDGKIDLYKIHHAYLAKPVRMVNDTDKPTIPEEYCELLIRGAWARAEEARDNYDFAAVQEQKYEKIVENMKMRYGFRQADDGAKANLNYGQTRGAYDPWL